MDELSCPQESKHEKIVREKYFSLIHKLEEIIVELDFLGNHQNHVLHTPRLIYPQEYLKVAQHNLINGKMWLNKFIHND